MMMKMMMMNRRSNVVRFETKEEEEDNNDDCFYESLDRVLSSCSCSTSNSDYDSDPNISDSIHDPTPFPLPMFPLGSSGFELWKSEPESVSERRIKLLRGLGLSNEPDLPPASQLRSRSRRKGICNSHFARSVSSDVLISKHHCKCVVRSDGAGSDNVDLGKLREYTGSRCSCSSSSVNMLKDDRTGKSRMRNGGNNGVDFISKEPMERSLRDIVEKESLSNLSHGNGRDVVLDEQMCTIRNLDTGKEFVVNEVREDGMLEMLKEVGTDRQLTLEEFELCVGTSPIVLELMRRQNVEDVCKDSVDLDTNVSGSRVTKHRRRGSWLKSIKNVASSVTGYKERRSTDDRDSVSERGGQRFSSATDDSRDMSFHDPERVKVRQYGKSCKELTALFKSQEIQAHKGSIWSIKFSLDGRYLASAGEDCVIQIWKVVESERKGELLSLDKQEDGSINLFLLANGSPEPVSMSPKRRGRTSFSRKSVSLDNVLVPEAVFGLSEKPVCSFVGHLDDVLDLSWSKSQVGTSPDYLILLQTLYKHEVGFQTSNF